MFTSKLKIIHFIRAPIGGAFRHMLDLATEQIGMGHELGIICASNDISPSSLQQLNKLKPQLTLSLLTAPMARSLSPTDIVSFYKLLRHLLPARPDVLHGHGAKGGAWARSISAALRLSGRKAQSIYSPHGGSLHYDTTTPAGKVYITLEKLLRPLTNTIVFTSAFEKAAYQQKVGLGGNAPRHKIVHNGLLQAEFKRTEINKDAAELLFIGELRQLKGVDLLINALDDLHRTNKSKPKLAIVGEGPDRLLFEQMVNASGLQDSVRFYGHLPLEQALPLGKIAVIPSRAEALPYVVLELLAAQKPLITTRVGGIPEIFGEHSDALIPPDDQQELVNAISWALAHSEDQTQLSQQLQNHLKTNFTLAQMAQDITHLYHPLLGANEELTNASQRAQQPCLHSKNKLN
ncbi:Alpha-D-kanosaminyltransferase [Pseudovibrio axinellae]|uniref:Alpha-D-kanosaminyltransferase n=1 Tax=Pseudovibrio axinellae TaxID=989403 RepID=A0A165WN48_9HYPH|nr:glycosyltransferase family 4 protein [Pseudovibrio axinellae]KZL16721.1 Alpha-D-kanosaminyltransferase [Pseudovibrio axinellae]SEQ77408.1 Glycosyltransferase involved in cell wall bisynthesis [Pseudovibrio axinellae]